MNEKGQVSSGMTWFVAIIAVFFIMLIFTGMMLTLAGKEEVSSFLPGNEEESLEVERGSGNRLILALNLEYFLEKNVDLMEKDKEKWTRKAGGFIVRNFNLMPLSNDRVMANFWLGVSYFDGEKFGEHEILRGDEFEEYNGYELVIDKREGMGGRFGTEPCDSTRTENFFSEFIYTDKKIAMCWKNEE